MKMVGVLETTRRRGKLVSGYVCDMFCGLHRHGV